MTAAKTDSPRGRGRPPFKPTAGQRKTVAIAAGGGMSHEEIAIGMGITRPTLVKHFEEELSRGAYAKRIEALKGMHAAAKRGNVSAAKQYLSGMPGIAPPPLEPPEDRKPARSEPEGKKARAEADAMVAHEGTDWAGLIGPSAVPQ